jgi:hypothetical protein
MFEMSVKLVPDWSVTMPPSGIGVPVAATPGLVPHDEVLTAAALVEGLALEVAGALLVAELVGAVVELLLLLLLLHPAITPPIAMTATAAAASRGRRREYLFMSSAFSWLTANLIPNGPGRHVASGVGSLPGGQTKSMSFTSKRCVFALPLDCVRCGLCSRSHRVFC